MRAKLSVLPKNYVNIFSPVQFGFERRDQFDRDPKPGFTTYIDSTEFEQAPEWLLKPDQKILSILNKKKFSPSKKVLIANRCFIEDGIMPSCRLAILLLHFGFQNVSILSGGLDQFRQDKPAKLIDLSFSNSQGKLIQSLSDVQQILQTKSKQLVDVRKLDEYQGKSSGYCYCNRKGRIPGSLFHGLNLSKTANQMKGYQLDGHFLNIWKQSGINLQLPIVLYCGNGWRASLAMVYAAVNGVKDISLYSDGWIEWSKSQPIERGV